MAVDKAHIYDPGIYFITFTNYKWIPLFEITASYDLVYKWFDVLQSLGHYIVGYVIMPNHVHVLIGYKGGSKSINTLIGNGKRFMAYDIVKRLKKGNNTTLLTALANGVQPSDKRKGTLHEVFEDSFDIILCHTEKFINQKLKYIHANPVSKKWMLIASEIDYVHSSSGFYETGQQGIYNVMNYVDWIDKHWVSQYHLGSYNDAIVKTSNDV